MDCRTNVVSNQCCVGPMVCRTNGESDQWCVGPMVSRTNGVSDQWCVGPMVCRTNSVSDQWWVVPMVCRTNGVSDQWCVGPMTCNRPEDIDTGEHRDRETLRLGNIDSHPFWITGLRQWFYDWRAFWRAGVTDFLINGPWKLGLRGRYGGMGFFVKNNLFTKSAPKNSLLQIVWEKKYLFIYVWGDTELQVPDFQVPGTSSSEIKVDNFFFSHFNKKHFRCCLLRFDAL